MPCTSNHDRQSGSTSVGLSLLLLVPALVLLLLLSAGESARASDRGTGAMPGQPAEPAGDRTTLWLVDRREDRLNIWFGNVEHPDRPLIQGPQVFGQVVANGIAAGNQRLWLVYDDVAVQSLRPQWNPMAERWHFSTAWAADLPRGVRLLDLRMLDGQIWAVVVIEDRQTLDRIQSLLTMTAPAPRDEAPLFMPGIIPSQAAPTAEQPDPTADGTTEEETEQVADPLPDQLPQLAVLRLSDNQSRWRRLPLPEQVSLGLPAGTEQTAPPNAAATGPTTTPRRAAENLGRLWVVGNQSNADQPFLVRKPSGAALLERWTAAAGEQGRLAWRFSLFDTAPLNLGVRQSPRMDVLSVGRQTVVAVFGEQARAVTADLWLLRDDLSEARDDPAGGAPRFTPLRLGELSLDRPDRDWEMSMLVFNERLTLVVVDPDGADLTGVDLQGRVQEPVRLNKERRVLFDQAAHAMFFLALYLTAAGSVFLYARHVLSRPPPTPLPKGMVLCPLNFRMVSGSWDLLFSALIVVILTRSSLFHLTAAHPLLARSWDDMTPFLLWMSVYSSIGLVTETLGHRGIGKRIMELEIIDTAGNAPAPRQLLIRNLLKPVDLIVLPLLMLMHVTHRKQRFSDLLSGTCVIKRWGVIRQDGDDSDDDSLRKVEDDRKDL